MHWMIKSIAQGGITLLPQSREVNYLFQKHVTNRFENKGLLLARRFGWCSEHLRFYYAYKQAETPPPVVLELGTGWIPTVPLGLFLCGVPCTYTIDIQRLIRPDLFTSILDTLKSALLETFAPYLPYLQPDRFEQLQEIARKASTLASDEVFERLGIHALIQDARSTAFESESIDLIISNTTLEHIPESILSGIFKEFRRVLRPEGMMSHLIDMSDHYSHFDHSITPYNFLKYPSKTWRFFNNGLRYQNRLRLSDYHAVHQSADFEIIHERVNTAHQAQLSGIRLAPEFQRYSPETLAATSSWIISRPASPSSTD